ncbi:MAG: glycosyltransferase family 4 protein [Methanobacterium sp.]|uniref:glycosyltransferase family 4 protein n=1 Tax=Methanobacterium sp. TaxID=2164 RepID=UPI003C769383
MKILLVTYMESTHPGGINKVVREIAKNVSNMGHETIVLQPNPAGLPDEEIYEGFKIIRISSPLDKYLYGISIGLYQYLKKNLKDINPDIIHVNGYHTLQSIEVIHTIKRIDPNIPLIFSPYHDVASGTFAGKYLMNLHNFFGKRAIKKCDYITSSSQFEAGNAVKILNVDPNKLKVIPLGVDLYDQEDNVTIDFSKDIIGVDVSKDINDVNKINLLYSGYLINRKGVDFILKSLYALVHDLQVENVTLTIIGEGPENDNLIELSRNLNLDKYIEWKPFLSRDKLVDKIKQSDIFMLLSRSEAYGITVAEALSLGTPCIITENTALKEFSMEPGCFVVDYPPEPEKVASSIIEVYKNDVTIGPFTEKIRPWDKVSLDYERLYESLITE